MATEGTADAGFPKHFDGKRFYNPDARQAPRFGDLLRWKLATRPESSPRFVSDVTQSVPPRRVEGDELRITLVNHSTVLLQQQGFNMLTDPIWAERASPLTWIGPRRRRKPGVAWDNLPEIDVVLLSHNHYDHLDLDALRRLGAKGASQFVAPIGVGRLLRSQGIGPVDELDWGESLSIAGAIIHSVPALHFSARGIFDRNKTLWCGYVIEAPKRVIYFAADTAFGKHFAQIRARFGAPSVALLPIGAYEPRWFMSAVHMGPEEAVKAHEILGAEISVAIHHGTFQLADEGLDVPKRQLKECGSDSFLAPANGETVIIK
jgi:L-ascorbate metabolism protein UlaG (beta-lactamase superfamily)